ncbi:aminophospholipid-transporting P-type ATPase [Babesia caballi]|uniref:P-type phospholipid transporter n=1 Tax=Babesia caballi TaxID=5871 RepID=A0AAV4M3C9_BABCB|nr:aminophospholipid-transporting P-type ATPase [Babesia caballi]
MAPAEDATAADDVGNDTIDQRWVLQELRKPATFMDRVRFLIATRFNRRLMPGLRYVSIRGGSIPRSFVWNGMKNTKYNVLTFLPYVLYEQFKVFMNLFYLLISLSQLIPDLAVESAITYFGPLALVLFVSLLKEGCDDYKRYLRDREANSQTYEILTEDGIKEIHAEKITVGSIVKLRKNQRVPADMILLRSSEANGCSFIRTDQLDGETDWKLKKAVHLTQFLDSAEDMVKLNAVCCCEPPRQEIYSFNGKMTFFRNADFLKQDLYASSSCDLANDEGQKGAPSDKGSAATVADDDGSPPNRAALTARRKGEEDDTPKTSTELDTVVEPLSVDNALWMNTIVAAGTVYGLVIYIGKEVRASLNARSARYKIGCFDWEVNLMTKVLFSILLAMATAMVIPGGFVGRWYIWLIKFLLLFSTIIPISLRINLDIAKFTYSRNMAMDTKIPGTVPRTTLIPEELGRIEYLLSDKTGTLTQNVMNLDRIHIGRALFQLEDLDTIRALVSKHFKEYKENIFTEQVSLLEGQGSIDESMNTRQYTKSSRSGSVFGSSMSPRSVTGSQAAGNQTASRRPTRKSAIPLPHAKAPPTNEIETKLCLAILSLAICHSVTPIADKEDKLDFQASSPDEIAMVSFARQCNVELRERDETKMVLCVNGTIFLTYKILMVFPFSSETKRMGIIVEDEEANAKFFFCKGAESALVKLLQPRGSVWLNEECDNMARLGLRTLVFGYRQISDAEFTAFEARLHDARLSLNNREEKIKRVISTIERDLILVALSGVQDNLQPHVRSTLEALRDAGIKIWMLTGDKVDTAKCIAISAGIKDKSHSLCQITSENTTDKDDIRQKLENFSMGPTSTMLVVDGTVVATSIKEFSKFFIMVAAMAPAVLCCRCTPFIKAELVRLIKQYTGKRTCAIGDGDNDVPMIMEADVGIGIVGKEGLQASLSADYSIHHFHYIKRLILWHGRNSYKSSASLTHFIIHRGMIIAVMQALFSAMYFYMPLAFFQGWLQIGFSTYYTMLPLYSLVLDYELEESVVFLFPELYQTLHTGRVMSVKTFLIWVWISVFQGAILMLGAIILFENSMLSLVSVACTSLFALELLNIYTELHTYHPLTMVSMICTAVVYFYSILILRNYFDFAFIATTSFVWRVIVITLAGWLPVYIFKCVQQLLQPPQSRKLTFVLYVADARVHERVRGPDEAGGALERDETTVTIPLSTSKSLQGLAGSVRPTVVIVSISWNSGCMCSSTLRVATGSLQQIRPLPEAPRVQPQRSLQRVRDVRPRVVLALHDPHRQRLPRRIQRLDALVGHQAAVGVQLQRLLRRPPRVVGVAAEQLGDGVVYLPVAGQRRPERLQRLVLLEPGLQNITNAVDLVRVNLQRCRPLRDAHPLVILLPQPKAPRHRTAPKPRQVRPHVDAIRLQRRAHPSLAPAQDRRGPRVEPKHAPAQQGRLPQHRVLQRHPPQRPRVARCAVLRQRPDPGARAVVQQPEQRPDPRPVVPQPPRVEEELATPLVLNRVVRLPAALRSRQPVAGQHGLAHGPKQRTLVLRPSAPRRRRAQRVHVHRLAHRLRELRQKLPRIDAERRVPQHRLADQRPERGLAPDGRSHAHDPAHAAAVELDQLREPVVLDDVRLHRVAARAAVGGPPPLLRRLAPGEGRRVVVENGPEHPARRQHARRGEHVRRVVPQPRPVDARHAARRLGQVLRATRRVVAVAVALAQPARHHVSHRNDVVRQPQLVHQPPAQPVHVVPQRLPLRLPARVGEDAAHDQPRHRQLQVPRAVLLPRQARAAPQRDAPLQHPPHDVAHHHGVPALEQRHEQDPAHQVEVHPGRDPRQVEGRRVRVPLLAEVGARDPRVYRVDQLHAHGAGRVVEPPHLFLPRRDAHPGGQLLELVPLQRMLLNGSNRARRGHLAVAPQVALETRQGLQVGVGVKQPPEEVVPIQRLHHECDSVGVRPLEVEPDGRQPRHHGQPPLHHHLRQDVYREPRRAAAARARQLHLCVEHVLQHRGHLRVLQVRLDLRVVRPHPPPPRPPPLRLDDLPPSAPPHPAAAPCAPCTAQSRTRSSCASCPGSLNTLAPRPSQPTLVHPLRQVEGLNVLGHLERPLQIVRVHVVLLPLGQRVREHVGYGHVVLHDEGEVARPDVLRLDLQLVREAVGLHQRLAQAVQDHLDADDEVEVPRLGVLAFGLRRLRLGLRRLELPDLLRLRVRRRELLHDRLRVQLLHHTADLAGRVPLARVREVLPAVVADDHLRSSHR